MGGFGVLQGIAGNVAARLLTEDKVAANLAANMPAELPVKMAEMGIKAKGETVLQKGAYVVVRVTIEHVDIRQLVAQKTGWDSWLYCCETPPVADHMLIR